MDLLENLLLALLPAVLCLWAYRAGARSQVRERRDAAPPTAAPLSERKQPKETPEERRLRQIMANVEAYDGTAKGQKEVV